MAVKRSILKSTVKKAKYNKALSSIRARLDALKPKQPDDGKIYLDPREWGENGGFPGGGKQPMPGGDGKIYLDPREMNGGFDNLPGKGGGNGMIHLDPREWGGNGGFVDTPGGAGKPMPNDGMIHLDPREWNGGFNQAPAKKIIENAFTNQERNKLQALLQQRQFQNPQPGPGDDGGIRLDPREWGENGGFDEYRGTTKPMPPQFPQLPERLAGFRGKFAGGIPQLPPRADPGRIMQQLQPTHGGGVGSIQLDPREWGENGGFNQMPKLPNPPMKQQPAPMPGMKSPMPGQGGGMPPKQMPMPNPKRNLIPRPINPKYKMM